MACAQLSHNERPHLLTRALLVLGHRYYGVGLYYYRRKDFKNKKYPEGIVTAENIAKEGEELGERISELDSPAMLKAFGP